MASFLKHEIVPNVFDSAPQSKLTVKFDSGVEASEGNVLTPTQVKNLPTVDWPANTNKFYTLIMTDPDVPTRGAGELEHWVVINIPGKDPNCICCAGKNTAAGETLAGYISSGPPKGTGLHRYIFVVYEQNGRIVDNEHARLSNTDTTNRLNWSAAKFAKKHDLGSPLFGNFYQAEYDDYVPILHKKLGLSR